MVQAHASATVGTIGPLLQYWRRARNMSQLGLAHEAQVSPRHVCFIETGRARPSRDMVLHLAHTLDVPLRERNALLLAAGFAPLFREARLRYPDVPARFLTPDLGTPLLPVLPVTFRLGSRRFNYFSTVTVLGTPQDITVQELRIESFFPADAVTRTAAESLGT